MTFTSFARSTQLNKATAKRILYTLEKRNFVQFDPAKNVYSLGLKAFELGAAASGEQVLLNVAKSYMDSLCNQINETVFLSQRVGFEQIYLAKTEGIGTVRLNTLVGRRRPLYYGLGKTILAYLCDQDYESCLPDPIPSFSLNTITERSQFLQDLSKIREQGYAVDDEEYIEGVVGVGFPIFVNRDIFGCVGVAGPSDRMTKEKRELVIKLLSKMSRAVSAKLQDHFNKR